MTSSSWCASSKTTTSCSGSTAPPLARWAPYRWVFTTTMSAADAGVAGCLGEASPPRRAVVGAGALARADAQHVPGAVGGLEAQVGPVAAARGLRPGHQPPHLLDQAFGRCAVGVTSFHLRLFDSIGLVRSPGPLVTQLRLDPARAHFGHPLTADVVAPPLQHGEVQRRRQSETRLDQWQVLLRQLVLQRLGRRGHDHLLGTQRGRDQIRERLARPRPGLHHEVGSGDQRLGHGTAHLLLLGPVLATRHLRRDLVEPGDSVVTDLPGVLGGPSRRTDGGKLVEVLGVVPGLLHAPIMPAGDDIRGAGVGGSVRLDERLEALGLRMRVSAVGELARIDGMGREDERAAIGLYERALDRSAAPRTAMVKLVLDARKPRLTEDQGAMISNVCRAVADDPEVGSTIAVGA